MAENLASFQLLAKSPILSPKISRYTVCGDVESNSYCKVKLVPFYAVTTLYQ